MSNIATAMQLIASEFVDEVIRNDRETGQPTKVNRMGFTQKQILSSVIWAMGRQEEDLNGQLRKAAGELQALIRSFRGDEISLKNLEAKQGYIEGRQMAVLTVQGCKAQAIEAFEAITGDTYESTEQRRARIAAELKTQGANPALAAATRLLATLGIAESAHPAKAQDHAERTSAA